MAKPGKKSAQAAVKDSDYLIKMSHAYEGGARSSLLATFPAIVFSAVVILLVRMYTYNRPMTQFFWSVENDKTDITDFFSYYKMVLIIVCAVVALLMILFRFATQSLVVRRSWFYVPIAVYSLFVILSHIASPYKEFTLLGWNDRFEGTIPLLCYMIMLLYVMNAVRSERDVKFIVWPLAASSLILCLIGLSQALDHDFFQSVFGQKLIVPNVMLTNGMTTWQAIDQAAAEGDLFLGFTFTNREIYQTVYNINYVSFYLTLLIPLFGMLFVRAMDKESGEPLWKKIALAALIALIIYNFIGSASSGGFLGLGVMGLIGIVVFNKQLLKWIKPLAVLLLLLAIVLGVTADRWVPEMTRTFKGLEQADVVAEATATAEPAYDEPLDFSDNFAHVDPERACTKRAFIDYIETGDSYVEMSINGNPIILAGTYGETGEIATLEAKDVTGQVITLIPVEDGAFAVADERFFDYMAIGQGNDEAGTSYILVFTKDMQWPFRFYDGNVTYHNQLGYDVELYDVPHVGFEGHMNFGSGRGFIWSRTLPLLKKAALIGYGADSFCIVFPHEDYAGKYSESKWYDSINTIIDKPHNMYLGAAVGTGCVSMLALVALYGMYLVQSVRLFWKRQLGSDYLNFVGAGLMCGVTAFAVTGLVDDSTVSTMPMFYTLLGLGIAVNMMIKSRDRQAAAEEK